VIETVEAFQDVISLIMLSFWLLYKIQNPNPVQNKLKKVYYKLEIYLRIIIISTVFLLEIKCHF